MATKRAAPKAAAKKAAPAKKSAAATAKRPAKRGGGGNAAPPPPPPPEDAADGTPPEADAVFIGTVLQTASSSVAEVEPADDTVVVRVDEVVAGAPAFHDHLGEPVTVLLPDGVTVAEGDVHVFHVMAWIFGSGLAVRAVSVGDQSALAAAMDEAAAPAARVRERIASADRVVSGIVRQVQHVPAAADQPITEHDPIWNDATVEVHHELGRADAAAPGSVKVRFASSRDIRWHLAPKFSVGDRGVWMLGTPPPAAPPAVAAMAAALPDDHYLVVDPDDFQPAADAPTLMAELEEGGHGR